MLPLSKHLSKPCLGTDASLLGELLYTAESRLPHVSESISEDLMVLTMDDGAAPCSLKMLSTTEI